MNQPTRGDRPVHHDFRLQERDGTSGTVAPARETPFGAARDALRAAWMPPRDTFVTEDLPVLLTRLNLASSGAKRSDDADEG